MVVLPEAEQVENREPTLIDHDGRFRYYTLRETARLQTFPDGHEFKGMRIQVIRQIGNAVPPKLAEAVARTVRDILLGRAPRRAMEPARVSHSE